MHAYDATFVKNMHLILKLFLIKLKVSCYILIILVKVKNARWKYHTFCK